MTDADIDADDDGFPWLCLGCGAEMKLESGVRVPAHCPACLTSFDEAKRTDEGVRPECDSLVREVAVNLSTQVRADVDDAVEEPGDG